MRPLAPLLLAFFEVFQYSSGSAFQSELFSDRGFETSEQSVSLLEISLLIAQLFGNLQLALSILSVPNITVSLPK